MINVPEIELNNPFEAPVPDETANLAALTRSLRRAKGFGLIFAVCNQSELRERLMRDLAARLPEKHLLQIPLREPIDNLTRYLAEILAGQDSVARPDAVFVYGLESWLPAHGDEPGAGFVANLNLFRNDFPKSVPCPLVLWVPQHLLADIQDRAPDFASIRSGVYAFAMTSETRSRFLESYISEDLSVAAGLTLEEKWARIARLEHLLKEFQSLPEGQRNLREEAALMTSLAFIYSELERYNDAECLMQDSLQIFRDTLPAAHPDIIASINNLALLYSSQERYSEAEPLFKESLEIETRASPKPISNIVTGLGNLSALYNTQGRYAEAEPLLLEALTLVRASTPALPAATSNILNILGNVYGNTGREKKAEPLHKEALAINRATLPPQHPDIAMSLNYLAGSYINQGRYREAAPLLEEALEIVARSYGPEHHNTLLVAGNYVGLLVAQRRHEQSRDLIARFPSLIENIPALMLDQIMQSS